MHIYAIYKQTHFRSKGTHRQKVKGWKKLPHANGYQKKPRVAILISDKIVFKTKTVTRDKEGHYIMIKGAIQEEDVTIGNIYVPNIGEPKYIKQILTDTKEKLTGTQ